MSVSSAKPMPLASKLLPKIALATTLFTPSQPTRWS